MQATNFSGKLYTETDYCCQLLPILVTTIIKPQIQRTRQQTGSLRLACIRVHSYSRI